MITLALWLFQETAPAPEAAATPEPVGVALVGGDVYTMRGAVLRGATVLMKDGKIERVGHRIEVPDGYERRDVTGRRVLPGFVATRALMYGGLGDVEGKIGDAIDPFDLSVELAIASGITTLAVEPGSMWWWGPPERGGDNPTAILKAVPGEIDDIVVREPAFLDVTAWVTGSATDRDGIRRQFEEAREKLSQPASGGEPEESGGSREGEPDPYVLALQKKLPVRIAASREGEIRLAMRLLDEFDVNLVLTGAEEGWACADEMGRRGVRAIVIPRSRIDPDRSLSRPSGTRPENAAILHRAGVRVAILAPQEYFDTDGMIGRDLLTLPVEAAYAIRGGLDPEAALRAITIEAAEVLGVADRVGSIEEGKDADIIILDGDPLDYRTYVQLAFVGGVLRYDKDASPIFRRLRAGGRDPSRNP